MTEAALPKDFIVSRLTNQIDFIQQKLSELDAQHESILAILDFQIQDASLALKRLPQLPTGYAEIDNARGALSGRLAALESEKRGTLVRFRQERAGLEREIQKLMGDIAMLEL
ncbi:hypothetical protein HYS54_04110 [Candidatus Micrarchaeota archaeon]|nr:hypothetical protein [Candidatus Micrarchaeota archaeon]